MNNELQVSDFEFEGRPLILFRYKGMLCTTAKHLSQTLGYVDDLQVSKNINDQWNDEFTEGEDFYTIRGKELSELKDAIPKIGIASRTSQLMLIYEEGIYLTCMLTEMPLGRKLRRFIKHDVLPQLGYDNHYIPGRSVGEDDRFIPNSIDERRLALEERQFTSERLDRLVTILQADGRFSNDIILTYQISAAEAGTGKNLSSLKPQIESGYISPSQIAEKAADEFTEEFGELKALGKGITVSRVGRVISSIPELADRSNPIEGLAMAVMTKAKTNDGTYPACIYSPKAVEMIMAGILNWLESEREKEEVKRQRSERREQKRLQRQKKELIDGGFVDEESLYD